jgi:hypothetical protein
VAKLLRRPVVLLLPRVQLGELVGCQFSMRDL